METMANHERLIPDLGLCWVVLDGNRQCSRRAYGQPFCRQHNAKFTDAGRDAAKAHRDKVKAERVAEWEARREAREAEERANCNHRYTVRDDGICLVCGTDTGRVHPEVAARRPLYPNSTGGTTAVQQVKGFGPTDQVDALPDNAAETPSVMERQMIEEDVRDGKTVEQMAGRTYLTPETVQQVARDFTPVNTMFHCWPEATPGIALCGWMVGDELPADNQPRFAWSDCRRCKEIQDTPGAGKAAVAANAQRLAERGAETLPAIVTCPDCGGYKECGAARCPDCHRKRKAALA